MSEAGIPPKEWYLRQIKLFASLTDAEIEELGRLFADLLIPAEVDLLQDRQGDRVYLIKDGAVRIHTTEPKRQLTLALLGPGRLFRLSAAFREETRQLGATTVAPSYICVSTWPALLEFLILRPEVVRQILSSMAEQVFDAETWLRRFGTASPRARLADVIVELSDEFGEPTEAGNRIRFRLTHADLAQMIGVSRETVSRYLSKFCHAGWVTRVGGLLVVRDRERLVEQATGQHDTVSGT